MTTLASVPFTKFHGLQNDFIVCRDSGVPEPFASVARAIANRHTGIGADGLLLLSKPRNAGNHARLRFFNGDGSEAEMSGNGIRCAAAFLAGDRGFRRALRIETVAGVKTVEQVRARKAQAPGKWTFKVSMGAPIFDPVRIPFQAGKTKPPIVGFPLSTGYGRVAATVTSMGNPHCSIFVPDFSSVRWREIGREIERLRCFPHRTNVEFVHIISRAEIEVRYWERGVGETVSSGTGSCAAAVASILSGRTRRSVRVRTPAGSLRVDWTEGGEVHLTGPAEMIARGIYRYSSRRTR